MKMTKVESAKSYSFVYSLIQVRLLNLGITLDCNETRSTVGIFPMITFMKSVSE